MQAQNQDEREAGEHPRCDFGNAGRRQTGMAAAGCSRICHRTVEWQAFAFIIMRTAHAGIGLERGERPRAPAV